MRIFRKIVTFFSRDSPFDYFHENNTCKTTLDMVMLRSDIKGGRFATLLRSDFMVKKEVEMNPIAKRVRQIRKKTGYTQVNFARLFNIPVSTYEQWERNNDQKKPQLYVVNWLELAVDRVIESNYSDEIIDILQKK